MDHDIPSDWTVAPAGPVMYRYDLHRCPACGKGIKKSKHLAIYLVGPCTGVWYLLCKQCGKQARTGLSEPLLNKANEQLEAFAIRAGLVSGGKHGTP